jgi:hypothetical protein
VDWAPGLASFATYIDRRDKFSALTTVPTSLVLPLACSIQHTGNDELTVTGASNYFKKSISGTDQTSLVLGWTLFEITWSNPSDPVNTGAVSRLYRLKEIHTDKIVRLMGLDGTAAQFPGSLTGAILERIFTPTMVCPDGVQEMQYLRVNPNADLIEGGSFMALAPPRTSDTFGDLLVSGRAGYFGAYRMDAAAIAMEWGGYEHRTASTGGGTYRAMGSLRGNGDLHAVNIFASADVTITDDLFVGDNLNVGGNAAVEGTLTVLTDLVVEGGLRFPGRRGNLGGSHRFRGLQPRGDYVLPPAPGAYAQIHLLNELRRGRRACADHRARNQQPCHGGVHRCGQHHVAELPPRDPGHRGSVRGAVRSSVLRRNDLGGWLACGVCLRGSC